MNMQHKLLGAAVLAALTTAASADMTNGPDPYAPGFGFDRPHEAAWGGWTRGAVGTLYAEWDSFRDNTHGTATDRTSAPGLTNVPGVIEAASGIGSANVTNPWLGWNAGTFVAGAGNLYSFSVASQFQASLTGAVGAAPATRAVLQVETWGNPLNGPVTLNGLAPSQRSVTFSLPDHPSSFGPVLLEHLLFIWDLPQTALPMATDDFLFSFGATHSHLSLAQVAVDIAPVPLPPAVALLGTALAGLGVIGRRKA